jgi:hypothetical protein
MSAATDRQFESALGFTESEHELAGELQHELELANELVGEFEHEHEQETEHEAFFNSLAAMADRTGRSQALRRIALAAARSALRGQARPWPVVEGEAGELESEFAGASESAIPASPARLASYYAAMEHEGHAAAEAANEQEAAEHFLPLIGLAAKFVLPKLAGMAAKQLGGMALKRVGGRLLGRAGSQLLRRAGSQAIRRVTPQLTRGVANVARTLFRNRTTRPLVHAVPRIARTTVARLARQVATGRPVTPQQAVRVLAQQTARTLSDPRMLAQTYRRSLASDRRYHLRTRRVLGQPVGPRVRANGTEGVAYGATPVPSGIYPGFVGAGVPTGGAAWSTQNVGACRCSCPPAATAGSPLGMSAPPVPAAMPTTCPMCGR